MMPNYVILVACLMAGGWTVQAEPWQPTDDLMRAVRFVESSHGKFTFGDNGLSLGDYQLSEAAWLDVSSWRKERSLPVYKYDRHVWDRAVSRQYAADYLTILYGRLEKRLRRPPTAGEIYAAYNMGFSSFLHCRCQLANVNSTTAKKCEQIKIMLNGK